MVSLVVELYKNNPKLQEPKFFYSEYSPYNSSNITIYLDVNYHIEIHNYSYNNDKNSFWIDKYCYYQFLSALLTVKQWLTTEIGKDLFYKDAKGIIHVNNKFKPIVIKGKWQDNTLEITPFVMTNQMATEQETGIALYINGANEPVFLNTMTALNFIHFMSMFNMHQSAMELISFLGKPIPVPSNPASTESMEPKKSNGFLSKVGAKEKSPTEEQSSIVDNNRKDELE